MSLDEIVGRNVTLLRGARSQKAVAEDMRRRGWRWSQATVWSVERGERPLRLTEARDLADVLQAGGPGAFFSSPTDQLLHNARRRTFAAHDQLGDAVDELLDAQAGLALAADEAGVEGEEAAAIADLLLRGAGEVERERLRHRHLLGKMDLLEADLTADEVRELSARAQRSGPSMERLTESWAQRGKHSEATER